MSCHYYLTGDIIYLKRNWRLTSVICVADVHEGTEVGTSQEDTDKSNEGEDDWLKKLTDFAG